MIPEISNIFSIAAAKNTKYSWKYFAYLAHFKSRPQIAVLCPLYIWLMPKSHAEYWSQQALLNGWNVGISSYFHPDLNQIY